MARGGDGLENEDGLTVLRVEFVPYVREGRPPDKFLIKQPVFRCRSQLWAREACQGMEIDVIESRKAPPGQDSSDDSEKGMLVRDRRDQRVDRNDGTVGQHRRRESGGYQRAARGPNASGSERKTCCQVVLSAAWAFSRRVTPGLQCIS